MSYDVGAAEELLAMTAISKMRSYDDGIRQAFKDLQESMFKLHGKHGLSVEWRAGQTHLTLPWGRETFELVFVLKLGVLALVNANGSEIGIPNVWFNPILGRFVSNRLDERVAPTPGQRLPTTSVAEEIVRVVLEHSKR